MVGYWTSAKDTGSFKWDNGLGQPIDEIQYPIVDYHGTCVLLLNRTLIADPCDASLGFSYYSLCTNIPVNEN